MKPFNLEAALAGEPVVTQNGTPVTQLTLFEIGTQYPLFGVIGDSVTRWGSDGLYVGGTNSTLDLFMAPKKRTVWVNFNPNFTCSWHLSEDNADTYTDKIRLGGKAYPVEIDE